MVAENVTSTANSVVDAMKSQPLALALIIVNLMFLAGGLYAAKTLFANIATAETHRSEFVNTLVEKCLLREQK